MKLLVWFILCAMACVAYADGTPSVVVNNYLGREYGPPAPAPGSAPPLPQSESHLSPTEENETNGFYLGILGGVAKGRGNQSFPCAGFAPKLRFGRFFALEGTLVGAATIENPKAGFLEASAHFTGQLTFRSAVFDFTPKAGIGVTRYGRPEDGGYTGVTGILGVEVELGRLVLGVEARGGLSRSQPRAYTVSTRISDPSPPLYGGSYYPDYSYYDDVVYSTSGQAKQFVRAEFDGALKLGPKDRIGVKIIAAEYGGEEMNSYTLYYRFGF